MSGSDSFDTTRDESDRFEFLAAFAELYNYPLEELITVGFTPTNLAPGEEAEIEVLIEARPVTLFLPVVCRDLAAIRPPVLTDAGPGNDPRGRSVKVSVRIKSIVSFDVQVRLHIVCHGP